MTKTSWGLKRHCPRCEANFYDLGKNPANCPKCGFANDINATVRPRRARGKAKGPALVKPKIAAAKKPKKDIKGIEGVDAGDFEEIEPLDSKEEIEELEEVEDIDALEEIEDVEAADLEDDITLKGVAVADKVLIDVVDDDDLVDIDEEEEDTGKKAKGAKPVKVEIKGKPAKTAPKALAKSKPAAKAKSKPAAKPQKAGAKKR